MSVTPENIWEAGLAWFRDRRVAPTLRAMHEAAFRRIIGDGIYIAVDQTKGGDWAVKWIGDQQTPDPPAVVFFEGVIDATGYGDYQDCRYWVKTARAANTSGVVAMEAIPDDEGGLRFVATNFAEMVTPASPATDGLHLVPVGTPVRVGIFTDGDGNTRYYFWQTTPHVAFVVYCYEDGGDAGLSTCDGEGDVDCTFTYTIKDLYGNTLATELAPIKPRNPATSYISGDGNFGIAVFDSTESYQLLEALAEVPDASNTPIEGVDHHTTLTDTAIAFDGATYQFNLATKKAMVSNGVVTNNGCPQVVYLATMPKPVAGTGISIDYTDPFSPVYTATGATEAYTGDDVWISVTGTVISHTGPSVTTRTITFAAGTGITLSGGDPTVNADEMGHVTDTIKTITISADGTSASDVYAKVSATDDTTDYLGAKIVTADTRIEFSVIISGTHYEKITLTHGPPLVARHAAYDITQYDTSVGTGKNTDTTGVEIVATARTILFDNGGHRAATDDDNPNPLAGDDTSVKVPQVLNDLADVVIATPTSDDVLTWNGSHWVNSPGVPGPKGDKGDKGDTGDTGPDGSPGSGFSIELDLYVNVTANTTKTIVDTRDWRGRTIIGGLSLIDGTASTLNDSGPVLPGALGFNLYTGSTWFSGGTSGDATFVTLGASGGGIQFGMEEDTGKIYIRVVSFSSQMQARLWVFGSASKSAADITI